MKRILIFTDGGGFKKEDSESYTATSAFRMFKYEDNEFIFVCKNTEIYEVGTNNYAEINAIKNGLKTAREYIKSIDDSNVRVEIYSDSDICVRSLTEWIWGWIKNSKDGQLYNSEGKLVKNQEVILKAFKIMEKIREGGGVVRFYHINSHGSIDNIKDLRSKFMKRNSCKVSLDDFCFFYLQNKQCDLMVKEAYNNEQEKESDINKN